MDRIEEKILSLIDANADRLQALADDIFHHAEQGYHEYRTAKLVADFLKELGLETREGLAITGVKAAIGTGKGPNVALIGELDGLACPTHPDATELGFAHSCGHYAQIVCMLGAALALSDPEVAVSLDGTATIFAVPAEEFQDASVREEVRRSHGILSSGGKCELLRRGLMDDIDLAVTTHSHMAGRGSTDADLMLGCSACTGFIGKTIYMHGRAAHAAAAPHLGANALNAACLGMSALGMIRETFEEKDCVRVHPYIRKGGDAINIVPSEVVVDNEDAGFRIVESKVRHLLGNDEYVGSPDFVKGEIYGWVPSVFSYAYGDKVRSFYAKMVGNGDSRVEWTAQLPEGGEYELYVHYLGLQPRFQRVDSVQYYYTLEQGKLKADIGMLFGKRRRECAVSVRSNDGYEDDFYYEPKDSQADWVPLGRYVLDAGAVTLALYDRGIPNRLIFADAIKWVKR